MNTKPGFATKDSLNEHLWNARDAFNTAAPAEVVEMIEAGATKIESMDIVSKALREGDEFPDVALLNQNGEMRLLKDYLAKGPLIVTMYRGQWCPYCNLQLATYREHLSEFASRGATLVAVSPEKPDADTSIDLPPTVAIEMIDKHELPFDVLFDEGNVLAKQLGIVFTFPEEHQQVLQRFDVVVEEANGDNSYAFPDPATYVLSKDGIIRWAFLPNNYRKRAEVSDIVAALERLS
ncbi:MAG: peroxiredoxin-like family protein [Cyanobacteria bacterium P01_E01_bin.6]